MVPVKSRCALLVMRKTRNLQQYFNNLIMASSFVSFKERGFWVYDNLLECITGLLYIAIRRRSIDEKWMQQLESLLKANSLGYYSSYMHLDLDEFIVDEDRRDFFISLLNQAIEIVVESGAELDLRFIETELLPERHYLEDNWRFEIKSYVLLKVLYYFELLMYEKLGIEVSDPIFYKFH